MTKTREITIIGSSLAAGWVTSFKTQYDMQNGYAARLARLLAPRGWNVAVKGMPGDTTSGVLHRMDADLLADPPEVAVIALSMSNEGLETGDPDTVAETFRSGMERIVTRCRDHGILPVIGLCYANDNFTPRQYQYLKRMNLLLNSWNLPCIHFLGALDDGQGHFPHGHTFEGDHPDNRGHEELFLGIVPSLFDALNQGKPVPRRMQAVQGLAVAENPGAVPVSFIPQDIMHSWTLAFSVSGGAAGTVAGIRHAAGISAVRVLDSGQVAYGSAQSTQGIQDGDWHDLAVCHRYLTGETRLYLDGEPAGVVAEQVEPFQFFAGGGIGDSEQTAGCGVIRDFLVYRAALVPEEVRLLHEGGLVQGSLEVYAPLQGGTMTPNTPAENLAQSTAEVWIAPANAGPALETIQSAVSEAALARAREPVFRDKEPIEMDHRLFNRFEGRYEVAPGDCFTVKKEGEALYFLDRGQSAKLYPESDRKFFIKYPGELTVTFEVDDAGAVLGLVLAMGGREMRAAIVP